MYDLDLIFLHSFKFVRKECGEPSRVQDLFKRANLGRTAGVSEYGFVHKSHHSEFSDSCMKTPLWLARASDLTGPQNPVETSEEIATRTLSFLKEVRLAYSKRNDEKKEKKEQ